MAANAFAAAARPRRRSTRTEHEAGAPARHRLDVIAGSVPDVVRSAGGWLADRALAGWEVNVFVPDADDLAPLRILGVTPHRWTDAPANRANPHRPTAVAVSADMMSSESTVRDHLAGEIAREVPEVTVWGTDVPSDLVARLQSVEHVPSGAARAFKRHAMRAAALDDAPPTEVFHSGSRGTRPRLTAVSGGATLPPAAVWAPVR
ncbi:MAG TPA: hypothetical protein PKI77_01840 [Mycobacterium sp.]|nr:hypothetical protein [Mycobacterium sp.]